MRSIQLVCCWVFTVSAGLAVAVAETPRPNPARFVDEIGAFCKRSPETGGIVFAGSSSIRLWTKLKEDFPGLPVLNRGFGGAVSNDLIVYFETIVARHAPKLVVTYSGTNDLNLHLTVDESFADYVKFLTMVHERLPTTRVIVTSVKISQSRAMQIPQVHALNRCLETWCASHEWARYVDCTSYLADPQGMAIPEFFRDDRLHLSELGYAKWRAILEPVVREEWEKVAG
jgi:lysophospholipase L1-like esterase